ncbi:MAG: hypothetical protein J5808_05425 [Paludibacteraceae bacterium]|nr:hypothetical protein [Paludibacteraceae bacterium]
MQTLFFLFLCVALNTLIKHIRQLLSEHDCVIVPGLGGFVASAQSSRIQGGLVYPPCKQVSFNAALTHNDGLLTQAYMHKERVSYPTAANLLEQATARLTDTLEQGLPVRIEGVGTLEITDSKVLFTPERHNRLLPGAFGLSAIFCPAITECQADRQPATETAVQTRHPEEKAIVIPMHQWNHWHHAVAAIAAILVLMFIPLHLNNGSTPQMQEASVIPFPRTDTVQIATEELVENAEEVGLDDEEAGDETPYHVIIGSFKTQHKALQFVKAVPLELQPYLLYSDGRYRIAVAAFATEAESKIFMEQFVSARPAYQDAWILAYQPTE